MRAIVVSENGGSEVLKATETEDPTPGPGDVLIDIAASGVNFIDVYLRTGLYPQPTPYVPGVEGAGTVAAVGADVTEVAVGDRVAWAQVPGSYAERAVIPAAKVVPVPEGVSAEQAAGSLLQGMTAHYLLTSTYAVRPGDAVLVHAAAGGMGMLLTQLAKRLGARVIGTVSTDEKERLAREMGADEVLRYDGFAAEVRRLTDDEGVAAVYDGVGAAAFDINRLQTAGSVFLTRPTLTHHVLTREELLERSAAVYGHIAAGDLELHSREYALPDPRVAHDDLEGRRTTGKLLLIPSRLS